VANVAKQQAKIKSKQLKRDHSRVASSSGGAEALGAVDMGALAAGDMDMGDGRGKNFK